MNANTPLSCSARAIVLRLSLSCALGCLTLLSSVGMARATLPTQGMYEECAPYDQEQCASELSAMGSAGFRLVLNYTSWYGSADQIRAYAAEAQAAGLRIIWPLNATAWRGLASLSATYPYLAPDAAATTNDNFIRYAVGLVRRLPATWGYYVGDELGPSQAGNVAGLAAKVRSLDSGHPLLYVGQGFPSVSGNLLPFSRSADVIGADIYPVGEGRAVNSVTTVAKGLRQVAASTGKASAMVLQSFSWTQYPTEIHAVSPRWPTAAEILAMRNDALDAKPAMILWYNLNDVNRSDEPAAHWRDLVTAAFAPAPPPSRPAKPAAVRGQPKPSRTQQRRPKARRSWGSSHRRSRHPDPQPRRLSRHIGAGQHRSRALAK